MAASIGEIFGVTARKFAFPHARVDFEQARFSVSWHVESPRQFQLAWRCKRGDVALDKCAASYTGSDAMELQELVRFSGHTVKVELPDRTQRTLSLWQRREVQEVPRAKGCSSALAPPEKAFSM